MPLDETIQISYNMSKNSFRRCMMARAGLDKETVIRKATELANEIGYDKITLKLLAEHLNVQPPSLYNHMIGSIPRQNT